MSADRLETTGWMHFDYDREIAAWVKHALPVATRIAADPQQKAEWLRCGGTWFAGVNILPNDATGQLQDGPDLNGAVIKYIKGLQGDLPRWDKAQISVIYPGYPRPMPEETPAAFRFRRDRDAAHVDGLLPTGPNRRRHLNEPHGFVLGLPLTATSPDASPMVVWEGSHALMRAAFKSALEGTTPEDWSEIDLTDIYQATRRHCFETCKRVEIHAQPGQAYLIHRLALHGVAPWSASATAPPEGRVIAYFRPELANIEDWLA